MKKVIIIRIECSGKVIRGLPQGNLRLCAGRGGSPSLQISPPQHKQVKTKLSLRFNKNKLNL
jgi:hypothetical protein